MSTTKQLEAAINAAATRTAATLSLLTAVAVCVGLALGGAQ